MAESDHGEGVLSSIKVKDFYCLHKAECMGGYSEGIFADVASSTSLAGFGVVRMSRALVYMAMAPNHVETLSLNASQNAVTKRKDGFLFYRHKFVILINKKKRCRFFSSTRLGIESNYVGNALNLVKRGKISFRLSERGFCARLFIGSRPSVTSLLTRRRQRDFAQSAQPSS